MSSFKVRNPFVLHLFLDRYISNHVANSSRRAMGDFLEAAKAIYPPDEKKHQYLIRAFENGIAAMIDVDEGGVEALPLGLKFPLLFPGGYLAPDGGHATALLFEHEPRTDRYFLTHANSGEGISSYHSSWNDRYECIQTYRLESKRQAVDILREMAEKFDDTAERKDENIQDFYDRLRPVTHHKNDKPREVLKHSFYENAVKSCNQIPERLILGSRSKMEMHEGRLYMLPQIAGTCSFHSLLWISFYMLAKETDGRSRAPQEFEKKLRAYVLDNLDLTSPEFEPEEIACLRLVLDEITPYEKDNWTQFEKVIGILNRRGLSETPPAPGPADHYTLILRNSTIVSRWPVQNFVDIAKKIIRDRDSHVINIGDDMGSLRESLQDICMTCQLNKTQSALPMMDICRTLMVRTVERVCDELERVCQTTGNSEKNIENWLCGLPALCFRTWDALWSYGQDPDETIGLTWRPTVHHRFQRALLRMSLLAVRLQSQLRERLLPVPPSPTAPTDPSARYLQFVETAEQANLLAQYVPYTYVHRSALKIEAQRREQKMMWSSLAKKSEDKSWRGGWIHISLPKKKLALPDGLQEYKKFIESRTSREALCAILTLLHVQPTWRYPRNGRSPRYLLDHDLTKSSDGFPFLLCASRAVGALTAESLVAEEGEVTDGETDRFRRRTRAMGDIVALGQGTLSMDDLVASRPECLSDHLQFDYRSTGRVQISKSPTDAIAHGFRILEEETTVERWNAYCATTLCGQKAPLLDQIETMGETALALYVYLVLALVGVGAMTAEQHERFGQKIANRRDHRRAPRCLPSEAYVRLAPVWSPDEAGDRLLLQYYKKHRQVLWQHGDSSPMFSMGEEAYSAAPDPGEKEDLPDDPFAFLMCRWILEYVCSHEEVCEAWVRDICTSDGMQDVVVESQEPRSHYCSPLVISGGEYTLYPSVAPSFLVNVGSHDHADPQNFRLEKMVDEEKGDEHFKLTRLSDSARLLGSIGEGGDEIYEAVSNLERGGFPCSVWVDRQGGVTIEFERGVLRRHGQKWNLKLERGECVGDWEVVSPHSPEIGPGVLEWGWNYTSCSSFWVHPAEGPRRGWPDILLLVRQQSLLGNLSVFSKGENKNGCPSVELAARTLRLAMHPSGLEPVVPADPLDTFLLFALLDESVKYACSSRVFWAAAMAYVCGRTPRHALRRWMRKYVEGDVETAHPLRHLLMFLVLPDNPRESEESWSYAHKLRERGLPERASCWFDKDDTIENVHRIMWGKLVEEAESASASNPAMREILLGRVQNLESTRIPTVRNWGTPVDRPQQIFEVARGMVMNRDQEEEIKAIWPDGADLPPPVIHQAVMGMGKSSILIPYLVVRTLVSSERVDVVVVVQPEHLVDQAYHTLLNTLSVLGLFGVRLVRNSMDFLADYRDALKYVLVVSDTALKEYYLGRVYSGTNGGDAPKFLPYDRTLAIYDEIDAMYCPLRSEYNIPLAESRTVHPLYEEQKGMGQGRWMEMYAATIAGSSFADSQGLPRSRLTDIIGHKTISLKSMKLNYHFGSARADTHLLAVPYRAAGVPMDRSSFSDIDVTAILTHRMLVETGLRDRDLDALRAYLAEWREGWPGPDPAEMDPIFQKLVWGERRPNIITLSLLLDRGLSVDTSVRKDQNLLHFYVGRVLFPRHLSFQKKRYNISFVDMMDISQYKVGFSGTVNMTVPVLDLDVGVRVVMRDDDDDDEPDSHHHPFRETIRESAYTKEAIGRAINNGNVFGNNKKQWEWTDQILNRLAEEKTGYTCIIDACAAWKDETNETVLDKMRAFLIKRQFETFVCFDPRTDKAVVLPVKSTAPPRPYVYGEGAGPSSFFYFDQRHSRGTDLVMPAKARALVLADASHSLLTDVAQAAFRLRWMNRGQTADYLVRGWDRNGTKLYERLEANEKKVIAQQNVRHVQQVAQANRRWAGTGGWRAKFRSDSSRERLKEAFLEDTPYSLDGGGDLGAIEQEQEHEQEQEQEQETVTEGSEPSCWVRMNPAAERPIARPLYRSEYLGTPATEMAGDLSTLGFVFSPHMEHLCSNKDSATAVPRLYITHSATMPITICVLAEYYSTPANHMYDRHGLPFLSENVSMDGRVTRPGVPHGSKKQILARLLCGGRLTLDEELDLLMPTKEETVTYYQCLYRVLQCLHSLGLVDVRAGRVLDEFLRAEPSEDNCVTRKSILTAFREKIKTPQTMVAHFLRVDSSSVSNLKSVRDIHKGYMKKIDSILLFCGQCGKTKRKAAESERPGPSKRQREAWRAGRGPQ